MNDFVVAAVTPFFTQCLAATTGGSWPLKGQLQFHWIPCPLLASKIPAARGTHTETLF